MAQLALMADLVTRWHYLHKLEIWQPDSATYISCIFGHQLAQLGLDQNLVIIWHHLHCLQSWPPACITWIATLPWSFSFPPCWGSFSLYSWGSFISNLNTCSSVNICLSVNTFFWVNTCYSVNICSSVDMCSSVDICSSDISRTPEQDF